MNVIVGVNDKGIEKFISDMKGINVLTTIKKKEQIIDSVIRLNPHKIILSMALDGRIDIMEVIKQLREVKPNVKIAFIYGSKDDEWRLYADFFVRNKIYNFLLGSIDENNLTDLILEDTPYEDVANYLLTKEDLIDELVDYHPNLDPDKPKDSIQPPQELTSPPITEPQPQQKEQPKKQVPPSKIEQPKPKKNTPPPLQPQPTKELEVLIVEKIVEREVIQTKVIGNIKIGVGSLFSRAGSTHTAIEIACYLHKAKCDVGIVVSQAVYDSLKSFYIIADNALVINDIPFYSNPTAAINNHKSVIFDYGKLDEEKLKNFYETNSKILLCPSESWEIDTLTDFLRDNDYKQNIEFAFFPIAPKYFKEIKNNLSKEHCAAHMLSYTPELFDKKNENSKTYEKIFQPLINSMK